MSKIEKKIRDFYSNSLKYEGQYENIANKLDLQKKERKYFMEKKNYLKFVLPCLLVVLAVLCIVLLGNNKPLGEEAGAVVQMDVNPSVSFVVAEDGTVISVYGENDEGKMLISSVEFKDLSIEEAVEKVLELEKETGYLVSGNVNIEENVISFTIQGDLKNVINSINNKIQETVKSKCNELNIKNKVEIATSKVKTDLITRALEIDPTLSQEEANAMDYQSLLKHISACQLEKINIPTVELEELYNNFKNHQIQIVEKEETKKVIDALDETYQSLKDNYNVIYDALISAQTTLNDAYKEHFIDEDSQYKTALKDYQAKKAEYLKLQNEIANMEENNLMKPVKELELKALETALTGYEATLTNVKNVADMALKTLNTAIEQALVQLEQFYNELPSEIKTEVTNSLSDLETKINEAKSNAFTEFETNYQADLEAAIAEVNQYKQSLINNLKQN